DYYAILDVQKTATKAEVKSAYRKAALKWHPDKNRGDELAAQKFRDVAQAYEVLSDDDRRKQYDRGGAAGPGGFPGGGFAGGFPGFAGRSADDIFKDVFGDGDPFADF
ncbi:DnaJ domain-containing protein, partial [Pelagophyceae sp. CCMP2097]